MALGWLIITFSNSYTTLLIGKIILGIPFGELYNMLFLNCMVNSNKISYFKSVRFQYFHYYKTCMFSKILNYMFNITDSLPENTLTP